jgi:hypothetical protein
MLCRARELATARVGIAQVEKSRRRNRRMNVRPTSVGDPLRLIVEIEIQHVPMVGKPKRSYTGYAEQDIPDPVPQPLLLVGP